MPCCAAMTAAPERSLPISPSRERVPSGNITQVPALVDQLVDVVGRAAGEPAAVAAERDGVEQQGDAVGLPALLVEVVGGGGDRGAVAPLARDRAEDRRRVQVARVVGDEDDRRRQVVEHVAPMDDRPARVEVDHRAEDEPQDARAGGAGIAAARPRDVHARVLARELAPARGQLGALRAQLGAALLELLGAARVQVVRHPAPQVRDAGLDLSRARLGAVGSVPHVGIYSVVRDRFRLRSQTFGWTM